MVSKVNVVLYMLDSLDLCNCLGLDEVPVVLIL